VPRPERLSHHDLCFGCGQANLFGLQLEAERTADGGLAGHFFVKQDHQGPRGYAHGGVIAAALGEAMSLLLNDAGTPALARSLELELQAPAAVGSYVRVSASVERSEGGRTALVATAEGEDGTVATARGLFVET